MGWPQKANDIPGSTEDHVASKGWWPTKAFEPISGYAAEGACATCHAQIFSRQARNAMAKAAFRSSGTPESGEPASDTFASGPYTYRFLPANPGFSLEVQSGTNTLASKVQWTFGAGNHGQTYLLEEGGALYESQVSSFATHRLALTPGHKEATDESLLHAIGNRLSTAEASRCFSCHTTAWSNAGRLELARLTPGVHCEACHGPGATHISDIAAGRLQQASHDIFNPAQLSPTGSIDFCGACHRTTMDIALSGNPSGVSSLRFQPYRLEKSRCWNETRDARLTCVACHDPHEPLVHEAAFYDQKCTSCHTLRKGAASASGAHDSQPKSCPKASANCTTCHMPKYTVPEMHSQFSDHFIRVAHLGEPFPN